MVNIDGNATLYMYILVNYIPKDANVDSRENVFFSECTLFKD